MKNFRALFFSSLRLAGNFSNATTQQSAKILSQEFWVYKSGYNLSKNRFMRHFEPYKRLKDLSVLVSFKE